MQGSITRHAGLALATVLAACGPWPAPAGDARPAVIPWISTVAAPEPTPAPTVLAMPFCQAADLSVRVGRSGLSGDTSVIFTNRGSTACQLQGIPRVRFLDSSGQVLSPLPTPMLITETAPVELGTGVHDGGGIGPAVAGQAQLRVLMPSNLCLARPSVELEIVLPNGAGELFPAWSRPAYQDPDCTQAFFASPFLDAIPPTPRPFPPPDFSLEYIVPRSVVIGQTLKYEVALTNVSGRDVRFTTCPSYLESIDGATRLRARYLLNCKPVGVFKSGEAVTFAMEFPIVATHAGGCTEPSCLEWIRPGPNSFEWIIGPPFLAVGKNGSGTITLTNF
ncbi:MAG TPA: DUF4232 domain-containing protein [Candidatus Eisenbacteria bacterium]|nr:DUF4232 domain-containing protein [Candidatus Eisenbacteria bacterium]